LAEAVKAVRGELDDRSVPTERAREEQSKQSQTSLPPLPGRAPAPDDPGAKEAFGSVAADDLDAELGDLDMDLDLVQELVGQAEGEMEDGEEW